MTELWQPVPGYEGRYNCSSCGLVRGPKGLVKPKPTNNGYLRTELWSQGERWRPTLHRLVATLFVPNPENKPQVNHLDGNKTNNKAENLEWCTPSENIIHAVKLHQRYGENSTAPKLTQDEVTAIRVLLSKGIPGTWIAEVFGITNAQVSNIRLNKQWNLSLIHI